MPFKNLQEIVANPEWQALRKTLHYRNPKEISESIVKLRGYWNQHQKDYNSTVRVFNAMMSARGIHNPAVEQLRKEARERYNALKEETP
jgi:hypothetical protein